MIGLRRIARIVGLFIVGLVLLFAIGEGFDPTKINDTELAMSAAFIVAMTGMVVLWKWESVGGVLVVVGMLAFYGLNFAALGRFPGGWVPQLCYLPGILSLVCWSHCKRKAARSDTPTT
ncbi:MAG: hypothetical protein IH899_06210 [Planctomycetes bacterium]|nr:hypothetical protein [Planctomycetota bacterium]